MISFRVSPSIFSPFLSDFVSFSREPYGLGGDDYLLTDCPNLGNFGFNKKWATSPSWITITVLTIVQLVILLALAANVKYMLFTLPWHKVSSAAPFNAT